MLKSVDEVVWYIPFVLIVCLGLYVTYKMKFIQFTRIPEMIRITFSRKNEKNRERSTFQVFLVNIGTSIGVGSITGPVLAITTGGPGAIFWMWVFALIGAATSFFETTLGQIYKEKNHEGGFRGGSAYNILHGLANPKLAMVMAVVMILMHFIGFSSMEACSILQSVNGVFSFDGSILIFSLLLSALLVAVMMGGFNRISRISLWMVPAMAVCWIVICCISIALSNGGIFNAFGMIFQYAFNIPAMLGGGIGAVILTGMKRGILSNEAGLGTSPYISATAEVKHPAQQGFAQSLGVMINALVCTLTALVVLSYGPFGEIYDLSKQFQSQELLQHVFQTTMGDLAPFIVMIFVFFFAFSSMMGTFVIGSNNVKFLTEDKKIFVAFCSLMVIVVFISAFYASDELYTIVNIFLGITATINCIAAFLLRRIPLEVYADYRKQKDSGIEEPVFDPSVVSNPTGITSWGDRQ